MCIIGQENITGSVFLLISVNRFAFLWYLNLYTVPKRSKILRTSQTRFWPTCTLYKQPNVMQILSERRRATAPMFNQTNICQICLFSESHLPQKREVRLHNHTALHFLRVQAISLLGHHISSHAENLC